MSDFALTPTLSRARERECIGERRANVLPRRYRHSLAPRSGESATPKHSLAPRSGERARVRGG
jgi:hypothetical protein